MSLRLSIRCRAWTTSCWTADYLGTFRRMRSRGSPFAVVLIACVAASCGGDSPTSPSQSGMTFVSFTSSPGDFIGQGSSRRFEPPATTFRGQMVDGNRRLELRMVVDGEAWFLDAAAPPGQQLVRGTYANAPSGASGLAFQFSGGGRGCTVGVSEFEVLDAVYSTPPAGSSPLVSGIVDRFHARFTQRCNGPSSPPLTGEVNIRALAPNRCATPSGSCQ